MIAHSNTLTQTHTHSNNRYANGDNEEIQKIGTQLLKNILDENSVLDAINRLKKNTAAMTKKGDEKAGEEVRKAMTQLAILARAEPDIVHKNGGIPAVLDTLQAVLASNKNPSQRNAVLDGAFRTLTAMVRVIIPLSNNNNNNNNNNTRYKTAQTKTCWTRYFLESTLSWSSCETIRKPETNSSTLCDFLDLSQVIVRTARLTKRLWKQVWWRHARVF